MTYAQIDTQGYCVGISDLSGELGQEDMIQLESFDTSLVGRKYDRDNQKWTDEYLTNEEPKKEPNKTEFLAQQLSDLEIQQLEYNSKATSERELLGQQLSDLEIAVLEGGDISE